MTRTGKIAAILLLLTLGNPQIQAQKRIKFERINIKDGLPDTRVNAITQDQQGFIWLATHDGLARFDGYTFTAYQRTLSNLTSLRHIAVFAVYEDRAGTLWVGSWGGGLARFRKDTEDFINYLHDPQDPGSLSDNRVISILEDGNGLLWVGTEGGGVNVLDPSTGKFSRYRHDIHDPGSLSGDIVSTLLEDHTGTLWLGTKGHGLNRWDPDSRRFIRHRHAPENALSLSDDVVHTIFEDRSGNLWVGTQNGLNRFDRRNDVFVRIQLSYEADSPVRSQCVRTIAEDHSRNLWIGTEGGGLHRLDPKTMTSFSYQNTPNDPYCLSDNHIYSIFEDRSGMIWIGTRYGGLNTMSPEKMKFSHFLTFPRRLSRPSHQRVRSIFEDRSGIVWVGTSNGLTRLDRATGDFTRYEHVPDHSNSLAANEVTAIFEDSFGILWLGTWGGGLDILDRKRGVFKHYRHDPADHASLGSDIVLCLTEDRSKTLWVGTDFGGLNRFDRRRQRFERFLPEPGNPRSISSDIVMAVTEDHSGILWIGTYGGGLNRMNQDDGTFTRYMHDPADPTSISHDIICCLHEDHQGSLWIGTYGGGLNRMDPEAGAFQSFGVEHGLPNNIVFGILQDPNRNLWVSTNSGLARIIPETMQITTFNARDGLQSAEFTMNAYHQNRKGEMYFGGINGFNVFYPESIKDNTFIPNVVFTAVTHFGREEPATKHFPSSEQLRLSYKESISFEFAALDYTNSGKNQYAYMLEGWHNDWIHIGHTHSITFANLKPGRYTLRVKGTNSSGRWSDHQAQIGLRITPPFWQSVWFQLLAAVVIAFAILRWHRTRMARQAKKLRTETAMERFFIKHNISEREREVILLILRGKSNKDIEEELFISLGTVKNHVYSIYQKLNVNSRIQLIHLFENIKGG
jgi:ligand-binding sensor domain-containing protein/DNA-binding CsgD family transcriptional regulator